MTGRTCATCAHSMRRFKATAPRLWCKQYRQPAIDGGCIDHLYKPKASDLARRFVRQMASK